MPISSLSRFLSLSIAPRTSKILSLHFATSSLADKLYTHLQKNPENPEKSLNSIKPRLDTACVNDVLDKFSFTNSLMGLRFFVWAGCQSSYRHSSFMYSKACNLFKVKQNPKVVLDLLEAYRVGQCVVSVKTFKVVLNLCKECRIADEALFVLKKMPEFGLHADTNAYSIVVRLLCEKGDLDVARKLMGEMGLINLYPDMVMYVSLIKGFCNVGRLEEACELLKITKGHGCMPNVVLYSTLLDGVCRLGSVERALELLGEMENEGGYFTPNVITYTSVIQRFCENGRTKDALAVLDRMEAFGCAPNRVTISALIKRLCMDSLVEEAYKLIDRVVVGGRLSYGDCYSSFVVCLIRLKRVEEAEKLFRKVLPSGVKLDRLACSLMIKELCLVKRVLDAFCLYIELEKIDCLSSIDYDTYSVLLLGLYQHSHSVEAAKLARSMLDKGIHLKAPYFDKIVEQLKKYEDEELVKVFAGIGGKC